MQLCPTCGETRPQQYLEKHEPAQPCKGQGQLFVNASAAQAHVPKAHDERSSTPN